MSPTDQLIEELKRKVAALEYTPDVLFDKRLAEIDLLVYKLRTAAIPPLPKGVKALDIDNIHEALKEILGE